MVNQARDLKRYMEELGIFRLKFNLWKHCSYL